MTEQDVRGLIARDERRVRMAMPGGRMHDGIALIVGKPCNRRVGVLVEFEGGIVCYRAAYREIEPDGSGADFSRLVAQAAKEAAWLAGLRGRDAGRG